MDAVENAQGVVMKLAGSSNQNCRLWESRQLNPIECWSDVESSIFELDSLYMYREMQICVCNEWDSQAGKEQQLGGAVC